MRRLLISQTSLLLYLSALFFINIFTANFTEGSVIRPAAYILIVFVMVAASLIPILRQIKLIYLIFMASVVFLTIEGVYLYVTQTGNVIQSVVEYFALILGIILMIENNHSMDMLKIKLDVFNVPKTKHQILNLFETTELIEMEFSRARRYNYPISVVKINLLQPDPGGHPKFEDPQQLFNRKLAYQQFALTMIKSLDGFVREFDQIIRIDDQKQILIICPETDLEHAKQLVVRLQEKIFAPLEFYPLVDVATFPEDGPTFRAVLSLMESRNN